MSEKPKEENINSIDRSEETIGRRQRRELDEAQKIKDDRELKIITSRLIQQYVSPATGFKGSPQGDELKEIQDRARMIFRQKKTEAAKAEEERVKVLNPSKSVI